MAGKSKTKPEPPEMPPGLSPAEEARWWDEHPEYWDLIDSPWEVVGPIPMTKSQPVNLFLPETLVIALKERAAATNVNYHLLIREWLEERLAAEAAKAKRKKGAPV